MFITLYEAEVGAISTIIKELENAKTKKEFNKLKAQITSYLYTVRSKQMSFKDKEKSLARIERRYELNTNEVVYWFWFEVPSK